MNILLEMDIDVNLTRKLYDQLDDFNFSIISFPFLCCNIPSSQFLMRGKLPTNKLIKHNDQQSRLKSYSRALHGQYNDHWAAC